MFRKFFAEIQTKTARTTKKPKENKRKIHKKTRKTFENALQYRFKCC